MMKNKAAFYLASICLLLSLLLLIAPRFSPNQAQAQASNPNFEVRAELLLKNTPKPTVVPTPLPIEYRTEKHNPGLIIGAVVLLLIIVFGVLRYSRHE